MRISDWSSDVCSSDLVAHLRLPQRSRSVPRRRRLPQLACHLQRSFVPSLSIFGADLICFWCICGLKCMARLWQGFYRETCCEVWRSEERRVGEELCQYV